MTSVKRLDSAELKRHPLPAIEDGDKDSHGRVLIIGGSRNVPGSVLLSAHGAMRAGAGKLQVAVPNEIAIALGVAMPEAMAAGVAGGRDGGFAASAVAPLVELARSADAIVAGPGMTANRAAQRLARKLRALEKPIALDAAMLHALADAKAEAKGSAPNAILLPHSGELASLLDCSSEDVEADPLGSGRLCAKRYRALVLVKGAESLVVEPAGQAWKYEGGGPGLGVSGSGDVLAGIVGGLLARGAEPLTALLWAVWLHGEAGARLSNTIGKAGFLAREIPDEVPALLA